jgi:phage terminase large subunit GpA-like protein
MVGARDLATDFVDAEQLLDEIWREYMAPPPRFTVTEWAEENRVLSGKDSAEPGPYRVSRTPYAKEPQDCLSAMSPVQEVVLMWGAQTSKTTVLSNWMGYSIDCNPGPLMLVQPTLNLAKRYSRQRFAPMIDECRALWRKVKENRSRDSANTTLMKEFDGGVVVLAGANSAADLRSMPVRDLGTDEEDGYPHDVDGEGDPVDLARARQTTFARRKHLRTSTPTTKDFSRIETAYLASDRCRYHVPCPHCGAFQPLEWGEGKAHGIKWSKAEDGTPLPDTVRYVCQVNGCEIQEHHKATMLARGVWIAENPGAQGGKVRGFHLSSLYSPLGWLSWATLVVEWVAAKAKEAAGDVSKLRVFTNTRLAETFEEKGGRADHHALMRRAADIPLRQVQWGHVVMTGSADVQGDRLEASLWAWGRGMARQLVDRVVFHGDPALLEHEPGSPWAKLTEYRRTTVLHVSGRPVPLLAFAVDSGGHHTQAVYAYCRAHAHANVLAVKGESRPWKPVLGKPTDVDVNWMGQKVKGGLKLWYIGTDSAKSEIYGRLRVEAPGAGYVLLSKRMPAELFEQLTAEVLVGKYVRGRSKLEWVKPAGKRNELLDMAVYALAMAHWVGIDRWGEGDWLKWEACVEERDLFGAPPQLEELQAAAAPAAPTALQEDAPPPAPAVVEAVEVAPAAPSPIAEPDRAQGQPVSRPWRRPPGRQW